VCNSSRRLWQARPTQRYYVPWSARCRHQSVACSTLPTLSSKWRREKRRRKMRRQKMPCRRYSSGWNSHIYRYLLRHCLHLYWLISYLTVSESLLSKMTHHVPLKWRQILGGFYLTRLILFEWYFYYNCYYLRDVIGIKNSTKYANMQHFFVRRTFKDMHCKT